MTEDEQIRQTIIRIYIATYFILFIVSVTVGLIVAKFILGF